MAVEDAPQPANPPTRRTVDMLLLAFVLATFLVLIVSGSGIL